MEGEGSGGFSELMSQLEQLSLRAGGVGVGKGKITAFKMGSAFET